MCSSELCLCSVLCNDSGGQASRGRARVSFGSLVAVLIDASTTIASITD